jgi:acetolactate synthase-1/2/3 large subunit|tara:strand:+ start:1542 stop:3326 length:1785 start_codon:yes stop_codon:yes gene_type:complete
MIRVADYIMERLCVDGAKHIFMVTGRGVLFLSDAVAAHKELKGISLHHEQSAAYATVAYAQYTGKLGACLVSTGCAGTNALTGVLNAWQDGVPCVFISGQNKLHETSRYTGIPLRTFGQQEADIISIVDSITKYAVMITDPKQIVYEMEKALYLAQTGRKGPVWIDVPLDIQNMRVRPEELEHFVTENGSNYDPLPEDIQYVSKVLRDSNRPAILIGSGIWSADAVRDLEAFLAKYSIPVTYAGSAPDTYGLDNPLSIGSVGTMGCSRAGNFTVQNSDLLLVLGCRLSPMTTGSDCGKFARAAKVVVVDIDRVEHSKNNVKIDRLIIADVKKFLTLLMDEDIKRADEEWRNKCLHWKQIFPKCEEKYKTSEKVDLYYLAECLSEALPVGSAFLSDSGLVEVILPTNISFRKDQRCIHPASQGSMGFALPGLVGVHYASDRPVIAVIGDGSIMMNLQELETIRYNNIPAKIFVINNNAYAVIRKRQVELFRSRTIGTDPSNGIGCPNFMKVAKGFEIPYVRIDSSLDLQQKLKSIIEMDGAVLCEIRGLENQEYIRSSHARNSKKRVVVRPIEDQAPYLNRELFLSEMIIKTIDQ